MTANAGYHSYATGDVLTAAQVQFNLQNQVIMYFATSGARTTALTGVVVEGMFSYIPGNGLEYYTGSAWTTVSSPGDITGVAAGIGISGGGTSGDVTITNSMATTIDAKGDLIVGTANDAFARVAVGTNNQTILADSTTSPGLKWAASPQSILGTTGDILYASAANTPAALAAGTSGYYLKANGAGVAPSWAAAAASAMVVVKAQTSFSNVAGTGTTFDNVFTATYQQYFVTIEYISAATNTDDLQFNFLYSGTAATSNWYGACTNLTYLAAMAYTGTNSGAVLTCAQDANGAGTMNIQIPNAGTTSLGFVEGQFSNYNGNSIGTFGGWNNQGGSGQIWTGFRLKSASTNITGKVTVYGLALA